MSGPSDPVELTGPVDPATRSGYGVDTHPPRMGFFTDTSVCIGCKACEVACKEWNAIPEQGLRLTGMSFDNTEGLGASSWRHVAFVEQRKPLGAVLSGVDHSGVDVLALAAQGSGTPPEQARMTPTTPPERPAGPAALAGSDGDGQAAASGVAGAHPSSGVDGRSGAGLVGDELGQLGEADGTGGRGALRWLMSSDVCKHCTHAACLDVCPTGALFRTEFGTVVVQEDVCNGCGYCVPACPYGVIDKRPDDGRVWKCTMCYDRLGVGAEPACAKACPTDSIQFGELTELRERARERVARMHRAGITDARLYGDDPTDGIGGAGAFFLLLDDPEVYGLPPDPVVTTRDLPSMWRHAGLAALTLLAGVAATFAGGRQ